MRYLISLLAIAAIGGCALVDAVAPGAAETGRQGLLNGLNVYCAQAQPVRESNRAWINENSPHTIAVTCAGDVTPEAP